MICRLRLLAVAVFGMVSVGTASGQQQESGMLKRLLEKPDESKVNRMQDREFRGSTYNAEEFKTREFGGTKAANVREFKTRSFLGIKNPWLGTPVFKTDTSSYADRTNTAARRDFSTESFGTEAYAAASKDANTRSVIAEPRKIEPKIIATERTDMQTFTDNLNRELTEDDIQKLLNRQ